MFRVCLGQSALVHAWMQQCAGKSQHIHTFSPLCLPRSDSFVVLWFSHHFIFTPLAMIIVSTFK